MSKEKIKICKECAYYNLIYHHASCHYHYREEECIDLVNGTRDTYILVRSNSPTDMRNGSAFKLFWRNCGKKGRFWKPKSDLMKPTPDDVE